NVILDTGSSDFWLVDNNCTSTECTQVNTFAANVSSSSSSTARDFTIRYGMGSASGQLWNDTVSLGGHELDNQTVALCDEVSGTLLGGNASGIMGLGFPRLSVTGGAPFWLNLMESNDTDLDFEGFSFYFTRYINATNASDTEYGGYFTLGTLLNETYTGEINYVDVPEGTESYWVVPMAAITLNGTNITDLGTPNVAIDSGTTLIGGPSQVVENFYESIGGAYALDQEYEGYYTYPCDSILNISFTFGNETYPMTADDLNLGVFNSATNQCLGAFFDLTLSSGSAAVISWVIGGAFLKNVYSVYRYNPGPSVGFANLSPSIIASSSRGTGSPPANPSDGHFVSGVFGGPTLPANGSTITGSPLDGSITPTSTPAAAAPAVNSLVPTSLAGGAGRAKHLLFAEETGKALALFGLLWMSIWTLGLH
ncbi:acid protease, partial [Cystobasidium minutum MCA 4210]|uniref:acid protease n=1 Tax=Cystobasidium minutum MCA 4210 TaxID=1397322 RepID=UPI0034CFB8F9